MVIRKATIAVTVLYDTQDYPTGLQNVALERIANEMDVGDLLGSHTIPNDTEVPADQVEAESVAIGNDGAFFTTEP